MLHYPCVVCGKEVPKPKYFVKTKYSGYYPIGVACMKKHPEMICVTKDKFEEI